MKKILKAFIAILFLPGIAKSQQDTLRGDFSGLHLTAKKLFYCGSYYCYRQPRS